MCVVFYMLYMVIKLGIFNLFSLYFAFSKQSEIFLWFRQPKLNMPRYYREKVDFQHVPKEEIDKYLRLSTNKNFNLLLKMSWLIGARIGDLKRIRKRHVDVSEDSITITLKSSKGGTLGYPTFSVEDPYVKDIISRLEVYSEDDFLFPRTVRRYEQILLELNQKVYPSNKFNWIVFHYLRHSRITALGELGATESDIISWTGHVSQAYREYIKKKSVTKFKGKIR